MRGGRTPPHQQLSLPLAVGAEISESTARVVAIPLQAKKSTFKGGLTAPVHRWFRLTPSFGPELVREMLGAISTSPQDVVLDPFSGAGTTPIECQVLGMACYGFEINPFLQWVAETSLDWSLNAAMIEAAQASVHETFHGLTAKSPPAPEQTGLPMPPIHNPLRWWRRDVLRDLLLLKAAIDNISYPPAIKSFLRLALGGVLVPDLTNVTLGRLQLHFIDRSGDSINVLETFERQLQRMIADLRLVQANGAKLCAKVFLVDSTDLKGIRLPALVDCVITSPPYPNRYSYVWNTRPHLYLFDFLNKPKEAAQLDLKTVGGTWGTATSVLARGKVSPAYPCLEALIGPLAEQIRPADNLMANYLVKYFNGIASQIVQMDPLLKPEARLAYVVGCSRLKGVYVETDVLLAELLERLGVNWSVIQVRRLRRRHSGMDLHESIVYARKKRARI